MDLRETLLDWLVSPETAYLIGAGCSCCAGKPLIGKLTADIVPSLDPDIQALFGRLSGTGARGATIEDLMNHLLKRRDILLSMLSHDNELLSSDIIDRSIDQIRQLIVEEIGDKWESENYHMKFLRRVRSPNNKPRDIFMLNYDTLFEASCEELRFAYSDGFIGAVNAYFDPNAFSGGWENEVLFRIYKLHGSINWVRDEHDFVRRKPMESITLHKDSIVVYPSEQKYVQTQYGVYETLMALFRARMRSAGANNRLVCLGYSFNDDHINEAILDAARHYGNNLSIYAFVGPENYVDGNFTDHQLRLQRLGARCPGRFNAYVGDQFYIGDAADDELSCNLLSHNLWKFECLVEFLAGGGGQ